MLRLILGTDWVANRDAVHNMLAEDVRQGKSNRILMVPELISHDTERRLCSIAGDTASRFAEVLSFSRLTTRVSEYTGVVTADCLDNGGRIVAMACAVRQLRGSLKAYASLETKPEFLADLVDAVDEFKRCCILPGDLKAAAFEAEGAFAQKLEELSLIYETYNAVTNHGKCDPRDQMTWLLEQLENSTFGKEHIFYIDGFPDFTRQHLAILRHLIETSELVVISLNCDVPDSHNYAFQKAGETARLLLNIAQKYNVPTDIQVIQPLQAPVAPLWEKLFHGNISQNIPEYIKVYQTDSVQREVALAAERIHSLVEQGSRYRDISLVCSDIPNYRTTINTIFHRCGIAYYLAGTDCVLDMPVTNTLLTAVDAVLSGFDQDNVISYLRSAASPLTLSQCDKLENYVLLWSISGNDWLAKWENHPAGLGAQWNDSTRAELARLEELRIKIMKPLVSLRDNLKISDKISHKVKALYCFLEEISFPERLSRMAAVYDNEGDNRSAQILNQLWEILVSSLEQLYDVLGDSTWDNVGFTRLLRLLLNQYDVGTIPTVLDAVTVGPVSAMRCQQAKHLIVLGVEEGKMPGYSGASGVLNDWERTALRQMGVPLTGGALEGVHSEFSEIYGVFCGGRESITISCPGDHPSFIFQRIAALSGDVQHYDNAMPLDKYSVAARLVHDGQAILAREIGIADEFQFLLNTTTFEYGRIRPENIRGLYGETLTLSASQVDKFAECRMRYFLQYGLRARERKSATVDPAEYGTYVHDVMEKTAREVDALGGFHNCTVNETLNIASKHAKAYIDKYFSGITSQRTSYLLNRTGQELDMVVEELWRELSKSAFEPVDFELNFGNGGKMPPICISGAAMPAQLQGFVDRVDVWENQGRNYVRVVDYKTGKKDFDYCDIFNGIGLQMLLYLFALTACDSEILGINPYPAGVEYFPARAPIISVNSPVTDDEAKKLCRSEWKRKGLILNDSDVLRAMQPDDACQFFDFRIKKDGEISGSVASGEQLRELERYIGILLRQFVNQIESGEISANPYSRGSSHNACAYCPYVQICRPEYVEGRRNYATMKPDVFWDMVSKAVKANG